MNWWTKTKNFVVKYWQWIVMLITAIAFYALGRSKDAKKQKAKFYEKWKDLEEEQRQELVEDLGDLLEEKEASSAENVLNFEEKKAKILEDAKRIETKDFLKNKGISEDED
jgi:acyl-CoA reductase-like NAD-dependent aldehyde dehydrogenase